VQRTPGSSAWTSLLLPPITFSDPLRSPSAVKSSAWLFGEALYRHDHDLDVECGCSFAAPSYGASTRHTCDEVVKLKTSIMKLEAALDRSNAISSLLSRTLPRAPHRNYKKAKSNRASAGVVGELSSTLKLYGELKGNCLIYVMFISSTYVTKRSMNQRSIIVITLVARLGLSFRKI
jgi:hypothetical protein